MSNQSIQQLGEQVIMNTYAREPIAMVKGEGTRVWDADGNEYLDFLSGIAVNVLGHHHPAVTKAIQSAAETMIHSSNYFWIESQVQLANALVNATHFDKVFFANSGAEVNEGAIKLARKWGHEQKGPNANEIITFNQSFHGRTITTLIATGQDAFHKHFDPFTPGFRYAEMNDIESVKAAVNENTCAVMLELIQGEGGVNPCDPQFIRELKELSEKENFLIIVDEIQTGIGHTGKLFAYEHYGLEADIMTLAKGLANGVPIGAFLVTDRLAAHFGPGDHGSTFGGNHLATAAGLATIETIQQTDLLTHVTEVGEYLIAGLKRLQASYPNQIEQVRGRGLMIGVAVHGAAKPYYKACLEAGLIISATAGNVLRLLPPLIITQADCDQALAIFDQVFQAHQTDEGATV